MRGPLALAAMSIPVFALAEASFDYLPTLAGDSSNHFSWLYPRFLLPWAEVAILVPIVVALARSVPLEGRRLLRGVGLHALAGVAFGATHLFLVSLVARAILSQRLDVVGFTIGLIPRYMLQDLFLYWTLVIGLQYWWQRRALHERELSQARLAAELAAARLAALESRLEPHFLFNTLNTAVMLVRDEQPEAAVDVLLELSELLRTVIDGAPQHCVPLHEEWTFIRRYLALEQTRFRDRLTVRFEQEPGLEAQPVPFLILQPLVENALRHGIAKRSADGPGVVEVIARRDGTQLRLEVRDNGPSLSPGDLPAAGRGVGLANVRARLRELYGERGELRVEGGAAGTVANVALPLSS